ncbi:hypothetical protein C1X25_36750, partial [Pseudomonas sp. GW247-3R2A]
TTRRMEQLLTTKQSGDTRAVGHFQLAKGRTDAPFLGAEAINEQLPLAGNVHFQRCATGCALLAFSRANSRWFSMFCLGAVASCC